MHQGPIALKTDALPTELSRPTHLGLFLVTSVASCVLFVLRYTNTLRPHTVRSQFRGQGRSGCRQCARMCSSSLGLTGGSLCLPCRSAVLCPAWLPVMLCPALLFCYALPCSALPCPSLLRSDLPSLFSLAAAAATSVFAAPRLRITPRCSCRCCCCCCCCCCCSSPSFTTLSRVFMAARG